MCELHKESNVSDLFHSTINISDLCGSNCKQLLCMLGQGTEWKSSEIIISYISYSYFSETLWHSVIHYCKFACN